MAAKETTVNPQRDKAIELALGAIEKQFGKGSIMRLGKEPVEQGVQVIPTGSIALDVALGVGGLPRGRIVEIYGPESSGKTTLTLHAVAEAQRRGGVAAFIDAEHALDVSYAKKLGVKIDELLVSQPDCGEQALEIADMLVRSNAIDIVVVDSVAALTPRAELEGEMGDSHVGLQARLMSQALRKLTGAISRSNCTVIFINQIRQKIGVMFGSPETTTGGNALKFYCSVRMDIRRIGAIKKDESVVGNRTRVKVVKNKLAPPFREVEFDILYGEGISRTGEILDLGVAANIIDKSGAWMSFNGERIGQGRDNAKVFLQEHPEVAEQLEAKLLAHHSVTRIGVDAPASAGDSARSDAIKGDAIKGDAIKGDAARGDAARGDAARGDAARGDAARGDAVRAVAEEPARPSRPQAEGKGAAGAVRNGSARGRANA
jgi:recombination protein RecA